MRIDPISRQHKFVQNHNLNHVVLSDTSGEARRAYGVSKVLGIIPGEQSAVFPDTHHEDERAD